MSASQSHAASRRHASSAQKKQRAASSEQGDDTKRGASSPESEKEKKPATRLQSILRVRGGGFDARASSRFLAEPDLQAPAPDAKGKGERAKGAGTPADPGDSSPQISTSPGDPPPATDQKSYSVRFSKAWFAVLWETQVQLGHSLLVFVLVLLLVFVLTVWLGVGLGRSLQRHDTLAAISKQGVQLPPNFQAQLDSALWELRQGDARKALEHLLALEQQSPEISSLTYLVALAAMQAGNPEIASAKAGQSIAKRERVSDSLALKAVLETQSAGRTAKLGDSRLRAEDYLRRAMVADAANPAPCIELATLLRYQQKDKEALQLLHAARSRLNPVDSHAVVDATIALLDLQILPDNELPENLNPGNDVAALFSSSYIAMRKGDFPRAASLLKTCRERLPGDLYYYLITDPAMRRFARQPEVAEFF
ncbi:MAG: hypothetical protein WCS65_11010 [Verrucomicrobiae bacterium]